MEPLPTVLTRREALARGMSDKAIQHRLATKAWQRPYRCVFVTHSGPIDHETRLAAVLAFAGVGAALSHQTSAARHGLRIKADDIHVTLPFNRRLKAPAGVVLHYSRRWGDTDCRFVRGLRCASVARTVLDLVDEAGTPGAAAALIVDAVGSRKTSPDALRAEVARHPNVRHHAALELVLAEAADGAHSAFELLHAQNSRDHGLPVGVRQVRRVRGGKVTYEDDVLEEYGVVTEMDGRLGHEGATDRFRDMDRDNANVEAGRVVLRVGWFDLLDRPCDMARQRAAVLRQRGWTGTLRRCGPTCTAVGDKPGVEQGHPQQGAGAQQPKRGKSGVDRQHR